MGSNPGAQRRYYVVLETEDGCKIRMERLPMGNVVWEPEPADLEDRNSLAKVIHSAECRSGLLVRDMKAYQTTLARGTPVASASNCKRHAQSVFARATGSPAPTPRPASSYCPPKLMCSFMKNRRSQFMSKKENCDSLFKASQTDEMIAKMRQEEKEKAKKQC